MPNGDLENHIAWGLKRLADFTDYVDHNQYIIHHIDARYIL